MPHVAPVPNDTAPEAQRAHLDLLRNASDERRLRLALSLSRTVMRLSRQALIRAHPGAAPEELDLRFVALVYGAQLAQHVRLDFQRRRQ